MTSAQIIIVVTIVLYLAAMVLVGVYFGKKGSGSSSDDFYLGGRKMGPVVTAMSAEASDMSSYLLMGLPGLAYLFGLPEVTWTTIGLAIGTYLNWLIVARRLRRYSAKLGAITIPDFFARRFGDKKHLLSCIAAVVILIFFIPYTASGFKAIGTLFNSLFGVEYHTAMIVGGIVVVLYTVMGGFMAVSFTDLIQSIFMTIALIVIVCFGVQQAGGLDTVIDNARALPGYLNMTQGYDAASGTAASFSTLSIISTLAWGLGYFGMPHIIVRFMSIEKASMVKKSATVAIIWVVLSLGSVCLIAYFGRMLVAEELLANGMQKTIFITLARRLFPAFIAGVLLAAIMAASMSTADSQLLVASSSFTSDIYKPAFRKNASDKEILWVGRVVVLVVAVVAYIIATNKGEGAQAIMNMVENAWGGFGSAFGPVVILSLFWRRFTYRGAIAGVVGGALVDVLWYSFLSASTSIYELLPGFIAGMLCAVVATLLDKAPAKEITDIYDKATMLLKED